MNEILIEQCNLLIDKTLPNIANISNLIALLYHEMKTSIGLASIFVMKKIKSAL